MFFYIQDNSFSINLLLYCSSICMFCVFDKYKKKKKKKKILITFILYVYMQVSF